MRSLKEWFDYVEKQAKELERKMKEEEAKVSPQPEKREEGKGKGVVFDEIYIGGKEGPRGRGIAFTLPEVEEKGVKRYRGQGRRQGKSSFSVSLTPY